jgi:hypothetical protein
MYGYDQQTGGSAAQSPEPELPAPSPVDTPALPAAVQRFQSCRWRKAADNGVPDHCAHRDVQPMTGTSSFDAEAWCPDCAFYKVRRNPRKRPPSSVSGDRSYY